LQNRMGDFAPANVWGAKFSLPNRMGGHFVAPLRNIVARNNISILSNNVAGYLLVGISRQSGDFMLYI